MPFTSAQMERVQLTDYESRPVALQFLSEEEIPVNLPTGPTTQHAVRAKIASTESGQPQVDGETLIFYQVVSRQVRDAAPNWVVGQLVREYPKDGRVDEDGTPYSYFNLAALPPDIEKSFIDTLQSAGID